MPEQHYGDSPGPEGVGVPFARPLRGGMAKGMTKGAPGKGVYRGDKVGEMTGDTVLDDFKIAEQFLPIGGRTGGKRLTANADNLKPVDGGRGRPAQAGL
jgi:hypothetical protein